MRHVALGQLIWTRRASERHGLPSTKARQVRSSDSSWLYLSWTGGVCTIDEREAGQRDVTELTLQLSCVAHGQFELYADVSDCVSVGLGNGTAVSAPEWFKRLSRWMWMAPEASDGWATIHVKPHIACFLLITSRIFCVVVWTGIFVGGFSELRWFRLVPVVGFVLAFLINTGMFWRLGPQWAATPVHTLLRVTAIVFLAFLSIPAFVGPESMTPFGSRSTWILTGAFGLWLMVVGAQLGAAKQNLFPEPLKSLGPPLMNSVWNSIRIVDPMTDMSLIRIVLNQVCHPAQPAPSCEIFLAEPAWY